MIWQSLTTQQVTFWVYSALDLNDSFAKIYIELGEICLKHLNRAEEAREYLITALEIEPSNLRTLILLVEYNISKVDKIMQKHSSGKKGFTAAAIARSTVESNVYLESAIRGYSKAIHMYPSKQVLYLGRGGLLLRQKNFMAATNDFHSAFMIHGYESTSFYQVRQILL